MSALRHSIGIVLFPGFSLWAYSAIQQLFSVLRDVSPSLVYNLIDLSLQHRIVESDQHARIEAQPLDDCQNEFDAIIYISGSRQDFNLVRAHAQKLLSYPESQQTFLLFLKNTDSYLDSHKDNLMPGQNIHNERHKSNDTALTMKEVLAEKPDSQVPILVSCIKSTYPVIYSWINKKHGSQVALSTKRHIQSLTDWTVDKIPYNGVKTDAKTSYIDQTVVDALDLIHSNIEEPLSAKELSDLLGISLRHLERLFRSALNETPGRYYMRARLEAVQSLIQHSSLTISEIAERFAFSSSAHLSYRYKSHFGIPPSKARAKFEFQGYGSLTKSG